MESHCCSCYMSLKAYNVLLNITDLIGFGLVALPHLQTPWEHDNSKTNGQNFMNFAGHIILVCRWSLFS